MADNSRNVSAIRPLSSRPRMSMGIGGSRDISSPPSSTAESNKKSSDVLHLEQRVRFLSQRETQLQRAVAKLESELHNAEERCLLKASAESSRLKAELQASNGRIQELLLQFEEQKNKSTAEIDEITAKRDEAIATLREFVSTADIQASEVAQLRREKQTALEKIAQLEHKITSLQSDALQMSSDLEEKWKQDLGISDEGRRIAEENRKLSSALDEKTAELSRLLENNERLTQQLGERKQMFQENRDLAERLKKERENIAVENERRTAEQRKEIEELTKKLQALQHERDDLAAKVNSLAAFSPSFERFDAKKEFEKMERLYALILSAAPDDEKRQAHAIETLQEMRNNLGDQAVRLTGVSKQLRECLVPIETDVASILSATQAVQSCISNAEKLRSERIEWEDIQKQAMKVSSETCADLPIGLILPSERQMLQDIHQFQDHIAVTKNKAETKLTELSAHNSQLQQSAVKADKAHEDKIKSLEESLRQKEAEINQLITLKQQQQQQRQQQTPQTKKEILERLRIQQLEDRERKLKMREEAFDWYSMDRQDIASLQSDVRLMESAVIQGIERCKQYLQRNQSLKQTQSTPPTPSSNIITTPAATTPSTTTTTPTITVGTPIISVESNEVLYSLEQIGTTTLQSVLAGLEKVIGYIRVLRMKEQEIQKDREHSEDISRRLEEEHNSKLALLTEMSKLRKELIQVKSQALQSQTNAMNNLASAVDVSASSLATSTSSTPTIRRNRANQDYDDEEEHRNRNHSGTMVFFYSFALIALLFAGLFTWANHSVRTQQIFSPS